MVDRARQLVNGHAKLVYLGVTALASLAALIAVMKSGIDDLYRRVITAAVLAPEHEEWIEEHEGDLEQLTIDVAVVRTQAADAKELVQLGFEQVIGILTRMENRLFEMQGRRGEVGPPANDGVAAQ